MQLSPADQATFDSIAATLRSGVAGYPPALRAGSEPALADLLAGEFSQLAALLPGWLADLAPLPAPLRLALGQAGLWLWWYARALDDTIDGGPVAALPAAQQALLRALEIYRSLGLDATPAWADLLARAQLAADAYARELAARAPDLAALDPAALAAWTPDLLMDRAAPFGFAAVAALELSGAPAADRLRADLPAALRALTGARQIADDAGDWLDDLRDGRLNYVSAALIRRYLRERGPAGLGLDGLAGYQLAVEPFWEELEQLHAGLCELAAERMRPYGPCRLAGLIAQQQASDNAVWARMRAGRASLRSLFGAGRA